MADISNFNSNTLVSGTSDTIRLIEGSYTTMQSDGNTTIKVGDGQMVLRGYTDEVNIVGGTLLTSGGSSTTSGGNLGQKHIELHIEHFDQRQPSARYNLQQRLQRDHQRRRRQRVHSQLRARSFSQCG